MQRTVKQSILRKDLHQNSTHAFLTIENSIGTCQEKNYNIDILKVPAARFRFNGLTCCNRKKYPQI